MSIPTKHWRLFKQRYRLLGSQCSSCGTKMLSPDKTCPVCGPHILSDEVAPVVARPAMPPAPIRSRPRLLRLATFLRWRDWGLSKVPLLCTACIYVAVVYHELSPAFVLKFLNVLLFAVSHAAFGYLINDWGDRYADRRRSKFNVFMGLSLRRALKAIAALAGLALLSGLPLVLNPWFVPLWITWVLLTLSFSLPPLRLKERGPGRWVVGLLAQWTLPTCLVFAAFGHFGRWDTLILALLLTVTGGLLDLGQA